MNNNELSDDISTMAALAYTPEEIGIALGIDQDKIMADMADPKSAFFQAYHKGRFDTDIKLRNSILKLAVSGSSPAQTMMMKIISQNEIRSLL